MIKIAYLCSEYPALSHTFISREIDILEGDGFRIYTASINLTKDADKLGARDRERFLTTYYIKSTPKLKILSSFLGYLLRLPRFLSVLSYCLRTTWFAGPANLRKSIGYFVQAILLHDWARRNGIAHIHVHFANPAATVAMVAARFGSLDFSMSVHGPDEFYDVERNNLREKIQSAVFIRCISNFCRSQLMRLVSIDQWDKIHIIRCGLRPDEFSVRPLRAGPKRSILCVGRVCPSKGQAILVNAAEMLRSRGVDFHILFLGGGEDLDAISKRVVERGLSEFVTLAGAVSHARVKEELAEADVFVLPSFAEGIPVALMEAMAAGVPVVSTRIAGIPELIEDGEDGFLTEASDAGQLADALEALLRGQVDTRTLLDKAAKKVRSEYDAEKNTQELGKLFIKVLG